MMKPDFFEFEISQIEAFYEFNLIYHSCLENFDYDVFNSRAVVFEVVMF